MLLASAMPTVYTLRMQVFPLVGGKGLTVGIGSNMIILDAGMSNCPTAWHTDTYLYSSSVTHLTIDLRIMCLRIIELFF